MISIYKKTVRDKKLKKRTELSPGSWLYVEAPTENEIKELSKKYLLDKILLSDAIDPFEVPRMEVEDSVAYVYARFPYKDGQNIFTTPLLIAISEDFLASVTQKPVPFFDKFKNGEINFYTTQKTKLFIQIFTELNKLYSSYLIEINKQVRKISGYPGKINDKDILQFVRYEEALNTFVSDLLPISNILKNLLSGKYLKLYEEDKDLVEDILLSTEQLIETCKATLKTIVNIREAYSTIVTNNLNRVIKILTVLTIILTIPTIVSSIYGMNVHLPLEKDPMAFIKIMGSTVVISVVVFLMFKRKDWL